VVGRDPACDLVLDDEQVSRRHAAFEPLEGGQCLLRDLGSTNGTWVDGRRLAAPLVLEGGEDVRLGQALLQLAEPASAPLRIGRRTIAVVASVACALAGLGTGLGLTLAPGFSPPGFPDDVAAARAAVFPRVVGVAGTVPSVAEAQLLERVPGWQRDTGCWRPSTALAGLPGATAAVGCLGSERVTVLYWQFGSAEAMNSWFARFGEAIEARAAGNCQTQQHASGTWESDVGAGGRIACGTFDGRDVIAWTAIDDSIGAAISLNYPHAAAYDALFATYVHSGPVAPGS
jgi:hypothetical protein